MRHGIRTNDHRHGTLCGRAKQGKKKQRLERAGAALERGGRFGNASGGVRNRSDGRVSATRSGDLYPIRHLLKRVDIFFFIFRVLLFRITFLSLYKSNFDFLFSKYVLRLSLTSSKVARIKSHQKVGILWIQIQRESNSSPSQRLRSRANNLT